MSECIFMLYTKAKISIPRRNETNYPKVLLKGTKWWLFFDVSICLHAYCVVARQIYAESAFKSLWYLQPGYYPSLELETEWMELMTQTKSSIKHLRSWIIFICQCVMEWLCPQSRYHLPPAYTCSRSSKYCHELNFCHLVLTDHCHLSKHGECVVDLGISANTGQAGHENISRWKLSYCLLLKSS